MPNNNERAIVPFSKKIRQLNEAQSERYEGERNHKWLGTCNVWQPARPFFPSTTSLICCLLQVKIIICHHQVWATLVCHRAKEIRNITIINGGLGASSCAALPSYFKAEVQVHPPYAASICLSIVHLIQLRAMNGLLRRDVNNIVCHGNLYFHNLYDFFYISLRNKCF